MGTGSGSATGTDEAEVTLERGMLTGVAALRWVTFAWAAVVFGADAAQGRVGRPLAGAILLGACLAVTMTATVLVRLQPRALLAPAFLAIESTVALAVAFADGWVYAADHGQSIGSAWPLAVVLTIGIRGGPVPGAVAGATVGVASWVGAVFADAGALVERGVLGPLGSVVLYGLGGGIAGAVADRLRRAERDLALAHARDEVARTLHDGVLQTLAIVQRRVDDPDLAALAREQEQDLRTFLFGATPERRRLTERLRPGRADLEAELREVARTAERRHALRVEVVAAADLDPLDEACAGAVAGAVAEALTNASKHGRAGRATVFLDLTDDGEVFCTVKDDGQGFDPGTTGEGVGLTRSIRGRVAEVGGRTEIDGRPGRGAEVRLWVPG